MQQTWSMGLDYLVFEGDYKILIDNLQGQHMDFNIENICWNISKWSGSLENVFFNLLEGKSMP